MKVAIIGAGVSGLASARWAIEYNLEVVVFEEGDRVGGIWNYNEDSATSSSPIYASLRTNLPVQLTEFAGFKFKPESGLSYPPHGDVLKYINNFVDHYDLRKYIKVIEVKRLENDWRISVENLSKHETESYSFDAVMVCNGNCSIPFVPVIPGRETFRGKQIHSRVYRRNTPFKGQRILVVGKGTSGVDIAAECCEVAAQVTVSYRSDTGLALKSTEIAVKPGIKFIREEQVFFEDNTSISVDVIIFCTGYLFDIPFEHESCGIKIHEGRIIEPLYKGFINIVNPSMCFIGLQKKNFTFPLVDLQAEVFIRSLTGHIRLPNRCTMMASFKEEIERKRNCGEPKSHYFRIPGKKGDEYCMSLSRLGNLKPIVPVLLKINDENEKRLTQSRRVYLRFEIIDDESFTCSEAN